MADTIRGKTLMEALGLTEGDRNKTYGSPYANLTCYANLVAAYVNGKPDDGDFNAVDGAILMVLAKISRIAVNQNHHDSYVDGAAYMAIADECSRQGET